MKRTVWVLLLASASLWADPETALVEKLYAKLAASFATGSGRSGRRICMTTKGAQRMNRDARRWPINQESHAVLSVSSRAASWFARAIYRWEPDARSARDAERNGKN